MYIHRIFAIGLRKGASNHARSATHSFCDGKNTIRGQLGHSRLVYAHIFFLRRIKIFQCGFMRGFGHQYYYHCCATMQNCLSEKQALTSFPDLCA